MISNLTLELNHVQIWQADLNLSRLILQSLEKLLSSDEQQRAQRFKFEKDRYSFIAARGILRTILSRYLRIDPEMIQFNYSAKGKPFLAQVSLPINFNLSHSQGKAIYAIALNQTLGIDLEAIRSIEALSLAKRFFCESEYRWLASLSPQEQNSAFFKLWTCKEAYLKATGEGLVGLQEVEIALPLSSPIQLLKISNQPELAKDWRLYLLPLEDDQFAATLAIQNPDAQLQYFNYSSLLGSTSPS